LLGKPEHPRAFVEEIGGGVAVYVGPHSPMNKLIGIGYEGALADPQLARIEEKFESLQAPLQAEVSALADPECSARLARRGYVLQGVESVLGRELSADWSIESKVAGIEIAPMRDAEREAWFDADLIATLHVDTQGVPMPLPPREELESALRPLFEAPGFLHYFARIGSEIAGTATLRIDAGIAQLCGAATLPAFRRRGVQTSLLRRRLADARAAGCELAVMTTQPGSKSQENGQRQGFSLLYSRALLVKG
jgi:GNAT superfamily N-acetyltransferase